MRAVLQRVRCASVLVEGRTLGEIGPGIVVLLGFGVGAVAASYIAGYFKDLSGGFITPFLVASGAALLGALLIAFLKPPKNKQ